jgi:hypothetical protein
MHDAQKWARGTIKGPREAIYLSNYAFCKECRDKDGDLVAGLIRSKVDGPKPEKCYSLPPDKFVQ